MGDERRINQLTAKAYDNIGSSDYFAVDNGSEAESKKLPASSIKTPISNLQGEVTGGSDTYSSTKNYSVGMYATHTTGGVQKLYRCKTACTAASWTTNASCFEEANLADAVSALNNDLSDSGWISLNSVIKYRKIGKLVEVMLALAGLDSPNSWTAQGTLPSGFRPHSSFVDSSIYLGTTAYVNIAINIAGVIEFRGKITSPMGISIMFFVD